MSIISIITPIKGRVDLFKQTLASVNGQSNNSWEWIIVDDGSSVQDKAIIRELCSCDKKMHYYERDDNGQGASYCRNYGAMLASCDWLIFLDADDILGVDFIKNRINDISNHKDYDFLAYRALSFQDEPFDSDILWNDFTLENDLDRFLKVDTPWQTTGVLWRKIFFNKIGGFNPTCKNWQDWEIHIRAIAKNPKYDKITRDIDFFYRKSVLSDISTKNTSKDFLLDRIKTIDTIILLLKRKGLLTTKRAYYLAKLLFSIELILKSKYNIHKKAIQIIKKQTLINKFTLQLWCLYVELGFQNANHISQIKLCFKKITDKFIYILYKDHFLDTKTNFLKIKYTK